MSIRVDFCALGRRIRGYRLARRLTQAALAERADLSIQFLGNIERGVSVPSLETLISLCYALEVNIDHLVADSMPEGGFGDPPECVLPAAYFIIHSATGCLTTMHLTMKRP